MHFSAIARNLCHIDLSGYCWKTPAETIILSVSLRALKSEFGSL